MQAWNVYLINKHGVEIEIDTVFYNNNCDAEYVKKGLIEHDGYNPNIEVRKA
jgi:hypothetical protein